jgi:hypothetical protein
MQRVMLESTNMTKTWILGINVKSCLTVNSSDKHSNLSLLCLESDLELHTKVIDGFLSFQMHPHATHLVTPNQNYCNQKIARKHEFQ